MARARPSRPSAATSRPPASPPIARLAAAAAGLGAGGIVLEIALTRLFSVLLFYHYVFLVLAVALLGLGLGGALAALLPDRATRGQEFAAGAAAFAAMATIAATVVSARWLPSDLPLLHGAVALVPFLFVGIALPLLIGARPAASGTVYGADLIGAAVGALAAFGLLYLGPVVAALGAATLFALAALLLQAPRRDARRGSAVLLGLVALVFAVEVLAQPIDVDLGRLTAGKPLDLWLRRAGATVERSSWDPFARTDVVYKPDDPEERLIFLDGAAGSALPHYPASSNEEMRRRSELGYFPYKLIDADRVLVIGAGGGLGVLHALLAGVSDVTAVEVSPGAVAAVRADGIYNGYLYDRDEVRVVVDEGRSFLRRDEGTYDLIDLSLVVSLATAQSGYALTENYLFTVEAFEDALDHLTDDGLIAVRLYDDPTLTRAFLTAATALRRDEASDAEAVRHLAVLFNPSETAQGSPAFYPLLVIGKQPFTQDTAQQLIAKADTANYEVIFAPFVNEAGPFGKVARGEASLTGIRDELSGGVFTPATDARPFFFEMTGGLPRPLVQAWIAVAAVVAGLGAVFVLTRRAAGQPVRPDGAVMRGLVYFALLGVGFMVVELVLLARLTLILGHPVIALATVLAGLLLAGGAGSVASRRLHVEARPWTVAVAAALVAAMALILVPVTGNVPHAILTMPLGGRVLAVLILLAPLGAAMGTLLPGGLRLFPGDATMPWAINGVGSVVGSVLATTLALKYGYPAAALTGALLYAALAVTGPALLGRPVWLPLRGRSLKPSLGPTLALLLLLPCVASASAAGTPTPQSWTVRSPMLLPKDDFATAVVDGLIYTFGGMTGARGSTLDDATVYDPRLDRWTSLPPLPTARRSPRAGAIGDKIYVVGGATTDGSVGTVEVWDTRAQTWTTTSPLPTPRYALATVVVGDRLYAIGGFRDGEILDTVERFDPVTDRWEVRAPLPTPRVHLAAVVLDDRIYALGGGGDGGELTTVEIYDPATDRWETGPPLPTPMSNFAAVILDGQIHVLRHFRHDVLDPLTEIWSTAPPMPTPRHGLGAAAVDGVLYAFGGCHEKLFDLNTVEAYNPSAGTDQRAKNTALTSTLPFPTLGFKSGQVRAPRTQVFTLCCLTSASRKQKGDKIGQNFVYERGSSSRVAVIRPRCRHRSAPEPRLGKGLGERAITDA